MQNNGSAPSFQHFIGVDVGKETLVIHRHGTFDHTEIPNTTQGIADFLTDHPTWLDNSYFVVDTTGGWERPLIVALLSIGVCIHRADGRKVKSFARSLGKLAKTDAIDATVLARYGHDRHAELPLCALADETVFLLQSLVTRRAQLAVYAKEEKQRLSGQIPEKMRSLIQNHLEHLQEQIATIEEEIARCISSDPLLSQKAELMKTLPGIGPQVSALLLAEMPELGQLDRREIAALAGLAPYAYDSGKMSGRRTTYGGRKQVKTALFLAAINAVRAKDNTLKAFYARLLENGKSKRCALVAVSRKLITILNGKIRDAFYQPTLHMSR